MSNHDIFKEFDNSLKTMVSSIANNNPAPKEVRITDNSFDHNTKQWYADVTVNGAGLKRVKALGYPRINAIAILIFIGGNYDSPYILCNPIDSIDYTEPVQILNLLPNGTFQKIHNGQFTHWTGEAIQSDECSYYGKTTCKLPPNQTITSNIINITSLRNGNKFNELMLYYLWNGGTLEVTVTDTDTNTPITFAPENLNNNKEILPDTNGEWRYNRSVFFERNHKHIKVTFKNTSKKPVYIDGIRIWKHDFEEWKPAQEDI